MRLINETIMPKDNYCIVMRIGAGAQIKLQMSVDNKPAIDITDAAWTVSTTALIDLPACSLIPVITGDADISIVPVK